MDAEGIAGPLKRVKPMYAAPSTEKAHSKYLMNGSVLLVLNRILSGTYYEHMFLNYENISLATHLLFISPTRMWPP